MMMSEMKMSNPKKEMAKIKGMNVSDVFDLTKMSFPSSWSDNQVRVGGRAIASYDKNQDTIAQQAERIAELEGQLNLYPMQPINNYRFEKNPIVDWLCTKVSNMNDISIFAQENDIDDKYQEQIAQLVGYSLGGYGDLSYVSDESYYRADKISKGGE